MNKNFRIYRFLPNKLKNKLHHLIEIFLNEKKFHGFGIEITEEIKVTISAQACILMLNKEHILLYPHLMNIFIYPSAFPSILPEHQDTYFYLKDVIKTGESWAQGPMILSWQHTLDGGTNLKDGKNIVIHEFAHQIDQEDGVEDGNIELPFAMSYKTWSLVMEKNLEQIRELLLNKNKKILIDEIGLNNPAEFFAVLTETFFEKPQQLKDKHPDIYELMIEFYRLDPYKWQTSNNDKW